MAYHIAISTLYNYFAMSQRRSLRLKLYSNLKYFFASVPGLINFDEQAGGNLPPISPTSPDHVVFSSTSKIFGVSVIS
jgi:hypothetical protein